MRTLWHDDSRLMIYSQRSSDSFDHICSIAINTFPLNSSPVLHLKGASVR